MHQNIVCIGDSTTSQEWTHPSWYDWLNFVFRQGEIDTQYNIYNHGIDGGNIDQYINNFEQLIANISPDIVIMSLGFNHLEGITDFKEKSIKLIKMIKDINCRVILWSTYDTVNGKYSKALGEVSKIYSDISKDLDCTFVDMYSEFRKYDLTKIFTYRYLWRNEEWDMNKGDIDFLHCNDIGNQIIATKILKECFNISLEDTADEWSGFGTMKLYDLSQYLKNA